MKISLAGQYQLTVLRLDGSIKHQTPFFDNLITDAGLNMFGGSSPQSFLARVGSGTTPPQITDTVMESQVATTINPSTSNLNQLSTPPYYGRRRLVFTFAIGAIQATISEVGVGTSTALFSRALISDDNGNPVSITLGAIDQLILTYDLYNYMVVTDFGFYVNDTLRSAQSSPGSTIIIDPRNPLRPAEGSTRPAMRSAAGLGSVGSNALSGQISAILNPSFGSYAYTSGSFFRDFYYVFNEGTGALSGANGLTEQWFYDADFRIKTFWTPAFDKTNLETVRLEGRIAWGRYQP